MIYRKYDPIVLIGINNPDNRNALNECVVNDLSEAVDKFENDETALAGVLFGEAGNFCAGYDFKELAKRSENPPKHFIENVPIDQFKTLQSNNRTNELIFNSNSVEFD